MIYSISALILLLLVIAVRTAMFRSPVRKGSVPVQTKAEPSRLSESLALAVQCRTVSHVEPERFDYPEFARFIDLLADRYPGVNRVCPREIINDYSLVYRWPGKDPDLAPLLFLGHYDVVPAETDTRSGWSRPPFGGVVAEGMVWGRGTLDMKCQIIAQMEAAEELINRGWQPERDIWFSYNFDEEQGGQRGAAEAVRFFKDRGMSFDMVFDEGGAIVQGAMSGVKPPMAIIGLGEKGMANIRLTVKGSGGHSSTPPRHSALGKLSRILADLERYPMKPRITPPVREMLRSVGPEMPLVTRVALANYSLFKPLILLIFSQKPTTAAMIRTTMAATVARAGDAPNVLPLEAEAVINCRLLPGDSGEDLLAHIGKIAQKSCPREEFELTPLIMNEASALSPGKSAPYDRICRGVNRIYPNALVTPYLMLGGSDSRQFTDLSPHVYRFMPVFMTKEELDTIHNRNERISLESLERAREFFKTFMEDYD